MIGDRRLALPDSGGGRRPRGRSAARRLNARCLLVALLPWWAVPTLRAQSGGGYVIRRGTADSAGHTEIGGGSYKLSGTVGQPDAGSVSGGTYALTGGFWSSSSPPPSPQFGNDTCVSGTNGGNPCTRDADCPGGACRLKNRYVSTTLPPAATAHGIQVRLTSLDANSVGTPGNYDGTDRWAGVPSIGINDGLSPPFNAAKVQCAFASADWSGVGLVHLYGDVVVPRSSYDVSICSSVAGPCSTPLPIDTARFGDVVTPVNTINFQDVNSIVAKFQGTPAGPSKTRTDLVSAVLNPANPINFQDVSACVAAFQSKAFKQVVATPPATCP